MDQLSTSEVSQVHFWVENLVNTPGGGEDTPPSSHHGSPTYTPPGVEMMKHIKQEPQDEEDDEGTDHSPHSPQPCTSKTVKLENTGDEVSGEDAFDLAYLENNLLFRSHDYREEAEDRKPSLGRGEEGKPRLTRGEEGKPRLTRGEEGRGAFPGVIKKEPCSDDEPQGLPASRAFPEARVYPEALYESSQIRKNKNFSRQQDLHCRYCCKPVRSVLEKLLHENMHSAGRHSFTCMVCGEKCGAFSILKPHMARHATDEAKCATCGEMFADSHYLHWHQKSHKDLTTYSCVKCDKSFVLAKLLKIHEEKHCVKRQNTEKEAERTYRRRCFHNPTVNTSVADDDAAKYDLFTSPETTFKKRTYAHLQEGELPKAALRRMRKFEIAKEILERGRNIRKKEEKKFVCRVCEKSFTQPGFLREHEKVHGIDNGGATVDYNFQNGDNDVPDLTEYLPYKCETCGKFFRKHDRWKKHQICHTGERNHCCSTCGKTFVHIESLKQHEIIHTGIKSHVCGTCGKSFYLAGNLRQHQKSHEGTKDFMCSVCGQAFSKINSMRRHEKSLHGLMPQKKNFPF